MLAVALTLTLALYVFGPDAFSRFVLDYSVPRRAVTLTKSEEVYRAVIWSSVSLCIAYWWERLWGTVGRVWDWNELKLFFSGVYSEQFFREHQAQWLHSARMVFWMNFCLLWRLYAVVLLLSLVLHCLIRYYASIRYRLRGTSRTFRFARKVLAAIVLPRIAPWHLLMSRILLRDNHLHLHVDVLTKQNILYQGRLADKTLGSDGGLLSVTLDDPRRFRRDEYKDAKGKDPSVKTTDFWTKIPTNIFIIMGSEVNTINLRYVPDEVKFLKKDGSSNNLKDELEGIRKALESLHVVEHSIQVKHEHPPIRQHADPEGRRGRK